MVVGATLLIEQGAMIAQQQKQIEALTEGLQNVSVQLEAIKPAPQIALTISKAAASIKNLRFPKLGFAVSAEQS